MPVVLSADNAPRSTYTLDDAYDIVRGDLGLRDSSLLTDDDLTRWLNQASDIIAQRTHWYRASRSQSSVADTAEYPFTGRVISLSFVTFDSKPLYQTTEDELDRGNPYWRTNSGTPYLYYLRGNTSLGLYPTPSTASLTIEAITTELPPAISAPLSTFYVPNGGELAILCYAKLRASEKDAAGEGARRLPMYQAEWREWLMWMKQQVNEVQEGAVLSMGSDGLGGRPAFSPIPAFTSIQSP